MLSLRHGLKRNRFHLPLRPVSQSSIHTSFSLSSPVTPQELEALKGIEKKSVWLSTYLIHHANNIREKRDGLKVGGHQASAASLSTVLTALYFHTLREKDRVAVKPHASPMYHSLQYLMGNQSLEQLQKFRSYGGIQSYPSRTKDIIDVDFSTGSVGLGATITSFSAFCQDWLLFKGPKFQPKHSTLDSPARIVSLIGDAELDEGNVFEGLVESWKHDMRNNWFIIDYNRQSLDKITEEGSWRQIDRMFRSQGWEVKILKYGKKLMKAFNKDQAGRALKKFLNTVDNDTYSSLVFRGGGPFRQHMEAFISNYSAQSANSPEENAVYESLTQSDIQQLQTWLGRTSDDEVHEVLTNLGGHCFETIIEAFNETDEKRTVFICYTVKGNGLPLKGHRDNHGLFLNNKQIADMQQMANIPAGSEWEKFSGMTESEIKGMQDLIAKTPFKTGPGKHRDYASEAEVFDIPESFMDDKTKEKILKGDVSTQTIFGHIMLAIAKSTSEYADRVMTMAPDVATSTNLSGFVSLRGTFDLKESLDTSKKLKVMSAMKWDKTHKGQHVELGIAEHNLMLMMAAAGMSANTYGQRILPVGTIYDPFISRGLDALNYGCYQDSRFLLVATPSGISLSPEGGAHQSINTPMIGMSQPGLTYFEPTFGDELEVMMSWAFRHMQKPQGEGGSVYLRLSTRPLIQRDREMTPELREQILQGAYWVGDSKPTSSTKLCLAYTGCLYPEIMAARDAMVKELGGDASSVSLLQITSPNLLYSNCHNKVLTEESYVQGLLSDLPSSAPIVTVLDGYPSTLTWLGAVKGNRTKSLGVSSFGQSGDLIDLYRHHGIDTDSIVAASKIMLKK